MFIPFVFGMSVHMEYDIIFWLLKYIYFANQQGYPIIMQERYASLLKNLVASGINETYLNVLRHHWEIKVTQTDVDSIDKYLIPDSFDAEVGAHYSSLADAYIYLLKTSDERFESIIHALLDNIIEKYKTPIEGILCMCVPKSLETVAKKRGIRIVSQEITTYRPEFYKRLTGKIDYNIYSEGSLKERYLKFCSENQQQSPLLSRKGILRLFANENYHRDIHLIDQVPRYEMGISMNTLPNVVIMQYTSMSGDELIFHTKRKYANEQILVRAHPRSVDIIADYPIPRSPINKDASPSAFHFIVQCQRVAAVMSNILFETMLVGRIAHNYGKCPYSCMANIGIEDESVGIAPLGFVNFVTFGYFMPREWMFDPEYLRYRLSNPPEMENYHKTFEYYTKNISNEHLKLYYMTDGYEYGLGDTLYFTNGCLPHETADYYFNGGFSFREGTHIWSDGDYSEFLFDFVEEITYDLSVYFKLYIVNLFSDAKTLRVSCKANGYNVGLVELKSDSCTMSFTIPAYIASLSKRLTLRLEYDKAVADADPRKRAVGFERMRICKAEINAFERKYDERIRLLEQEREEQRFLRKIQKLSRKTVRLIKKTCKCCLPYGFVRIVQKLRRVKRS